MFFINQFYLDMCSDLKRSFVRLSVNRLDLSEQVILDNLFSPLYVRIDVHQISNFSLNEVNTTYLSTA